VPADSAPSPRRRSSLAHRAILVTLAALGAVVAVAGPACAHVGVDPVSAPRGADALVSFSVPNEKDTASTTAIEITLPINRPMLGVRVQPVPGWTVTFETTKLARPIATDDGSVDTVVSKVTWAGGVIAPGQFQLFTITGITPAAGASVVFKAVQTYSDGSVVRWIETPPKGAPTPENPAPVLRLTKAPKSR